jgi:phospholipid transport system substrate-binding protein
MRNRRLAHVMLFLSLAIATVNAVAAADDGQQPAAAVDQPGTAVVERLQSALVGAMKGGAKLDLKGRCAQLEPAITQAHDFDDVVPEVFGDDWQRLTPAQKQTVIDLYRKVSVMTFAQQFNEYHGEKFQVLDEKPIARGDRIVRSLMRLPNGESVHFDYVLHQSDGQWRIVNTVFDGVSGFAMDRSRYQPLLQQRGADALIAELKKAATGQP